MERQGLLHSDVTDQILKSFYHVYNALGYGFLEKVYENSMALSLQRQGLQVAQQSPVDVWFEGQVVGQYFADLIVSDRVLLELKSAKTIDPAHEAQLINYLRATRIEVGLVLNFGEKPQFARKVFLNENKKSLGK